MKSIFVIPLMFLVLYSAVLFWPALILFMCVYEQLELRKDGGKEKARADDRQFHLKKAVAEIYAKEKEIAVLNAVAEAARAFDIKLDDNEAGSIGVSVWLEPSDITNLSEALAELKKHREGKS